MREGFRRFTPTSNVYKTASFANTSPNPLKTFLVDLVGLIIIGIIVLEVMFVYMMLGGSLEERRERHLYYLYGQGK